VLAVLALVPQATLDELAAAVERNPYEVERLCADLESAGMIASTHGRMQ
jgi:DNA-binding IscR family transcriptional regulator